LCDDRDWETAKAATGVAALGSRFRRVLAVLFAVPKYDCLPEDGWHMCRALMGGYGEGTR